MQVFELSNFLDDPRYEGFGLKEFRKFPERLPRNRTTRDWQVNRLGSAWKPLAVVGRVRKFNDNPGFSFGPAFSQRAVAALRDLLEPNGELLPLESSLGTYYFYNVTTVADVLDLDASVIKWMKPNVTATAVEHYEFDAEKLDGLSIFCTPEMPNTYYVTTRFVDRARVSGLKGFNFIRVWPMPAGMDWTTMMNEARDLREREGLPAGQWLKGNAVILRLLLQGQGASAAEKSKIGAILDELDRQLVDLDSETPPIGNVEGHDYSAPGECRLFLSCPDAEKLVDEVIRPWLKRIAWPHGIKAYQRYGHYRDPKADEKVVDLY